MLTIALFHFHLTQVKRSAGQSAIASAAYRAGEKLYSEYYGEVSDYTRKGGVVCSEIMLPSHAPPEYADRQTLWNAVEKAERGKKAQLAYSFDIALQNEFSMEENIALARQFLSEQLVSRGMAVDFAVHQPDKESEGISNPHFHILCPIRPLDKSGKWGNKQRREYLLDENGERIRDEAGNYIFNAVPTTDWGSSETLEAWRRAWADLCNAKFAEKGLECRIDHRSYLRQGIDLLPTVHEGPTVRAMEKKGIRTDKGNLNRWIKATNAVIRDIRKKIAALLGWIKEVREELTKPQAPNLAELLGVYCDIRNDGAWSAKAKGNNLKQFSEAIIFLTENNLFTVEELEARVIFHREKVDGLKSEMDKKSQRMKELQKLMEQAENYAQLKPVYDEMNAIKWKGKRENFKEAHAGELRLFYMARRKLEEHFSFDGKLPITSWRKETAKLRQEYDAAHAEYKPLRDELVKLLQVKNCVDTALRQQEQLQNLDIKNRSDQHER